MGKKTKTKKTKGSDPIKDGFFIGAVTVDEMEYLQCGMYQFINNNRQNAQITHKVIQDGEEQDVEKVDMADFWAQQNVDAQKLLDKLIALAGGRDLAMDGQ